MYRFGVLLALSMLMPSITAANGRGKPGATKPARGVQVQVLTGFLPGVNKASRKKAGEHSIRLVDATVTRHGEGRHGWFQLEQPVFNTTLIEDSVANRPVVELSSNVPGIQTMRISAAESRNVVVPTNALLRLLGIHQAVAASRTDLHTQVGFEGGINGTFSASVASLWGGGRIRTVRLALAGTNASVGKKMSYLRGFVLPRFMGQVAKALELGAPTSFSLAPDLHLDLASDGELSIVKHTAEVEVWHTPTLTLRIPPVATSRIPVQSQN